MPVAVILAATIEIALAHAAQAASRLSEGGSSARAIADAPSAAEPATRLESIERAAATCRLWEHEVAPASLRGEIVIVARRDPPTGGPSWPEVERSLYRIASGAAPAVAEIRIGASEADLATTVATIEGAIARRRKADSRPLRTGPATKREER